MMLMAAGMFVLLGVCLGFCRQYVPAWVATISIAPPLISILSWIKINPHKNKSTQKSASRPGRGKGKRHGPPVMREHRGNTSSAERVHTDMAAAHVRHLFPSKDDAHKELSRVPVALWCYANRHSPDATSASPATTTEFAACNSSSSDCSVANKGCCTLNMKAPATAPTATVLATRLDAPRVALNAKLAGHPMPNLAHYNCAMQFTRQIDKHLVYPSPYARGRSAYKIPNGNPEDAPDGWRDQIERAMVSASGKPNAGGDYCSRDDGSRNHGYISRGNDDGGLHLDAAYLRHGCIMLVVEYSRRRCPPYAYGAGVLHGHMKRNASEPQKAVVATAGGCSGYDVAEGRCGGSVHKAATAFSALPPVPVLSDQDLLRAFGAQLLQPENVPVQVGIQHFVDEALMAGVSDRVWPQTLSPDPMQLFEEGNTGLRPPTVATWDNGRATSAAAGALPSIALLGPPCVLASDLPLHLPILVLAAPNGPCPGGGCAVSSEDASVTPARETASIPVMLEPQPQPPRLLARYGCHDTAPQPCMISRSANEKMAKGYDWLSEDLTVVTTALDLPANEIDEPNVDDIHRPGQVLQQPMVAPAHDVGKSTTQMPASPQASSGLNHLCIVLGPCPLPGLILLEMDVHTVAAEEKGAAQHAESNRAPLLSWPLPVVVVDDPEVQREVNALAMVAATRVATEAPAEEANAVAVAEKANRVSPGVLSYAPLPHDTQRLAPAWLHALLYDLGQFLQLARTVGMCGSTRVQDGAALQFNSPGDEAVGLWSGSGMEQRSINGGAISEGTESDSDSSSWSAVDGGVDSESGRGLDDGKNEELLLCLAASLAAYACRQGLPSLLSCVLSRADGAGIPLLLLNEQVEVLSGGLGLAHLAALSGSAELMETLILMARTMATAPPALPPSSPVQGVAAAAAGMRVGRSDPGNVTSADCLTKASGNHCLQPQTTDEDAEKDASCNGMDGDGWLGGQLAKMNGCTALFVRPGPGSVTALHLVALMHGRSPDLAQPLLSLCPLAAHAWFGVRDEGGISAAQYALETGAGELNEQCEELLALEALESEVLGSDEPEKVLAVAIKAALQITNLSPGHLAAAEATQPLPRGIQITTAPRGSGPQGEASAVDGAMVPAETSAIPSVIEPVLQVTLLPNAYQAPAHSPPKPASPGDPCNGSSDSTRRFLVLHCCLLDFASRRAAPLKRLPWAAPLCGFADPSLERAFARRARVLALQRDRFALAFHFMVVAGCVQKFLVMQAGNSPPLVHGTLRPGTVAFLGELLIAVGGPMCKLLGNIVVLKWRLQSAAHDFTLISFAVLQGLIVGAVHLSGRPHPEAFEVADLSMQEALASLYHCVILPVMEQTIDPLCFLSSAVICTLMELPMAVSHGWHGPMAAALLAIRFAAGMTVRYSLAVWARASYLQGAAGCSGGTCGACGFGRGCRCSTCGGQYADGKRVTPCT
ncbi:hypothetical protein VaNZ11_014140 [Volvox africanus]|uniref:Uncharacterized protein n=1 Tax=Volvox africanus TaxID=51714 RepID=A0ABQ5SIN7_9CHLO|nr:hypothetical protein VaNZ11_014140 [Volvox africanus]